jgi:hypothetical protein
VRASHPGEIPLRPATSRHAFCVSKRRARASTGNDG